MKRYPKEIYLDRHHGYNPDYGKMKINSQNVLSFNRLKGFKNSLDRKDTKEDQD